MDTKAIATLVIGEKKVKGRLTTNHAASSYGQPVFVDDNGQAYNWIDIASIQTTDARSKGGQATSEAKQQAARENGRKSKGRPRKTK